MDSLKDKITKASESNNARFERKYEVKNVDKINEKLKESEKKLESIGLIESPKLHPPSRNKFIEKKIAEINKKIRRAKRRKIKKP